MRSGQLKLVSVAALLGTGGPAATAYAGHDTKTTTVTAARPTAIARTGSVGGYRFVKSPIIVRLDVGGQASDVSVYFRMNRRLPKGSYATVDGQPPARRALTPFVPKNDRCYRQDAGGTMRSPWMGVPLGTSATFALHIHGIAKALKAIAPLTAPRPIEKNANGIGNDGLSYERKLHCLRAGKARHSAGLPRAWPASPAEAVRGYARCTSGGAHVLAGNDKVLVVRRPRGHTWACVIATGQSRSLGDTVPGEGETKITVRRFVLAGSIVAFNWEYSREEVEQGVDVLDLRGHRRVRGYDAVSNVAAPRPHWTVLTAVACMLLCATAGEARAGGYGTGVFSKTRFVKGPIIVLFTPSKPDPYDAGYTIYFRLSRDLPRNPAGGHNAVFTPFEGSADPILGLLARPGRWCFTQDVGTDPTETGLPTKRGSKIHLILKAHDKRHRVGTLPANATLRVQKPRAANDWPYPYPKELGCPLG